jgi:pSer/pThr/pTyr-binding forkhead associated (FHA) protein
MKAKLVVVGGEAKATEIDLRLPTVIGRGREATLTLPHPLVSRKHCELYESDGRLMVRDLGSLNGTYVANERVTDAVLPAGELLTVGTVTFRAVYADSSDIEIGALPPRATGYESTAAPIDVQIPVEEPLPPESHVEAPATGQSAEGDTAWQPGNTIPPEDSRGDKDLHPFVG